MKKLLLITLLVTGCTVPKTQSPCKLVEKQPLKLIERGEYSLLIRNLFDCSEFVLTAPELWDKSDDIDCKFAENSYKAKKCPIDQGKK